MLKSWNEMRKLDISKFIKKRDNADYLPWSSCLMLLYENGAEEVRFSPYDICCKCKYKFNFMFLVLYKLFKCVNLYADDFIIRFYFYKNLEVSYH